MVPRIALPLLGLTLLLTLPAAAATCGPPSAGAPAVTPAPREKERARRATERNLEALRGNDSGTLLIGDSITARWRSAATDLGRPVSNFGVSGDRTENVLDRIDRADLAAGGFRRVVLLIGTNNLRRDGACDIVGGVTAIVERLHRTLPEASVYVVSILPRGRRLATARREIETVNRALAEAGTALRITYVDAFSSFAETCAEQERCGLFGDGLHPNEAGYALLGRTVGAALGAP